jgi:predicted DNA-binding transcriptional regulator YafY
MQRFDRILAILLFLRGGQSVSAAELAGRFEVSPRTIYRDIETLSALGVPVYAERGREGGFQLLEGYFLPPLMFSRDEAVSLLLGLTLLRSLQAKPFEADLETAQKKLLAAVPDKLRLILAEADKIIGFEKLPADIFHPEPGTASPDASIPLAESRTISLFLQAILDGTMALLEYRSPYNAKTREFLIQPLGLFWDRDHWYLAGQPVEQEQPFRLWRADRVLEIKPQAAATAAQTAFDVRELLEHHWLKSAMERWRQQTPVKIRLTTVQARRLQQDWYYRHAQFEPLAEDQILMTFGEENQTVVLELLRWLGPGAELLEPKAWRKVIREELREMLGRYGGNDD